MSSFCRDGRPRARTPLSALRQALSRPERRWTASLAEAFSAVLTDEGTRFVESARRLLEDYDEAVAEGDNRAMQRRLVLVALFCSISGMSAQRLLVSHRRRIHG
jgi:DNA-binding transcriptional LysR family regulator